MTPGGARVSELDARTWVARDSSSRSWRRFSRASSNTSTTTCSKAVEPAVGPASLGRRAPLRLARGPRARRRTGSSPVLPEQRIRRRYPTPRKRDTRARTAGRRAARRSRRSANSFCRSRQPRYERFRPSVRDAQFDRRPRARRRSGSRIGAFPRRSDRAIPSSRHGECVSLAVGPSPRRPVGSTNAVDGPLPLWPLECRRLAPE